MGYYIWVSPENLKIKAENKDKALKAIQSLHGKETNPDGRFSWVDRHFYEINDLQKMLDEWRWMTKEEDNGDIAITEFMGEKLGDDKILFQAIAPFIEDNGRIHFKGEDCIEWIYHFYKKELSVFNCTKVKQ